MKEYYKVLGVSETSTEDEIRVAYRKLSKEHHPDAGGDAGKFSKISIAYSVLSDKEKRGKYDNGEKISDIAQEAHSTLMTVFQGIVNENKKCELKNIDFVSEARQRIAQVNFSTELAINKLNVDIESIKEARERTSESDDGYNYLDVVFQQTFNEHEKMKIEKEYAIKVGEKMLEILDGIKYANEKNEEKKYISTGVF